jgi:FkbM family methyltransferase
MDSHDIENINYIEKIISPDWVIVDVGSCDGDYSEWFSQKISDEGKVISIELHPENYKKIKDRLSTNSRVLALNCAVSDIDGEIDYYQGEFRWLHNIVGEDVRGKECTKIGKIKSITLNSLLEEYPNVGLVKIDVEGSELRILKGMDKLFHKVENLIVECHNLKDWDGLKKILIDDFNFDCFNNSFDVPSKPKIVNDSPIAYQCVCKKK